MRALLIRAILFFGRRMRGREHQYFKGGIGMCIQAIKSVGVKEYASELWTSIKEIDGGKILSSASSLLEVNVKAIKNKIDALCDENTDT